MAASSFSFPMLGSFPGSEDKLFEELEEGRKRAGMEDSADLAIVFATADWRPFVAELAEIVRIGGRCSKVVGCSADGLLSRGREDEGSSGISVLLISLPEGASADIHLVSEWSVLPPPLDDPGGWILLADPFALEPAPWSTGWNEGHPGVPVYGGLASGGRGPGEMFLFDEGGELPEAVGLAIGLSGVDLGGLVSQGCRPIGAPYPITGAKGNVVATIGSQPAFDMLDAAVATLPDEEQLTAPGNILAGLASSEYLEDFRRGDFLVRSILGGDREAGAIALAAHPRVGQTIQFQLRDALTATEDLAELLASERDGARAPFAGLAFTCTGRGAQLFGTPHHDAIAIEEAHPGLEVAGFFCNGEVGIVAGEAHVHGFTTSLALLRERNESGVADVQ